MLAVVVQKHRTHPGQAVDVALGPLETRCVLAGMKLLQPFVFIGQSWGAMYATWFINEYGDYGGRRGCLAG